MNRALRLACILFIAACGRRLAPARAATYTWNTSSSGSFTTAANWTNASNPLIHAVPGANDVALFNRNLNISYAVGFPGSVSLVTREVKQVIVGKNTVNFGDVLGLLQVPARFVIDSGNALSTDALVIGDTATQTMAGLDTQLANFTTSGATIGNAAGSSGLLHIEGGNLNVNGNTGVFDMLVGNSGTGELQVTDAGQLVLSGANGDVAVGHNANSVGTVLVTDSKSKLTTNQFEVGGNGTGHVTVSHGGSLDSTLTVIGEFGGASGDVTVDGANSTWTNSAHIDVGQNADGSLTIQNGGHVTAASTFIGDLAGSHGNATVTGAGSLWDLGTGEPVVGYTGTGTLSILAGGKVTSAGGGLANDAGSVGTLHVSGLGSALTMAGQFRVGWVGQATMTVDAGGSISNTFAIMGLNSGSTADVTVSGSGSTWTNSSDLWVGEDGTATLTIESGGQVSGLNVSLGVFTSGIGTTIVRGAGSKLTANGSNNFVTVGNSSQGTLKIEDGGMVESVNGAVGNSPMATGTVTVSGGGSSWTMSNILGVGSQGGHGTLRVEAGGAVSVNNADIGNQTGATGAVTITGAGSNLNTINGLFVGATAAGTLAIENGGSVTSASGFIGFSSGSNGIVTVTGTNSKWAISVDLDMNEAGAGSLTVSNNGTVQAANVIIGAMSSVHGDGNIIANVQNGGAVAPGTSPGALHITGNYSQSSAGSLQIELGGTAPGTGYDQLLISGSAALNGTLAVSLINGYMGAAGDNFNIITFTSRTGAFSTVQLPALSAGLMWNAARLYSNGQLRVLVAGDYNANGIVDSADYTVWRDSLGQTGTGLAADGNGDNAITQADYNIWKSNFGQHAGSGAGANANAAVPEPATLWMLLAGLLTIYGAGIKIEVAPKLLLGKEKHN